MPHDFEFKGLVERLAEVGEYGSLDMFFETERMSASDLIKSINRGKRTLLVMYASGLDPIAKQRLVKALTRVEVSVGGLGSVSNVAKLLDPERPEGRQLLDWVLRNYPNYYYGRGARSIEEYDEENTHRAALREKALAIDKERHEVAQKRKAVLASGNLFNAVRRGDKKAVEALLERGADPSQTTPCGQSLLSYAQQNDKDEIVALLQEHIDKN